jgi:hypothetical protein
MLKIEPSSLKKSIVIVKKDKAINPIYSSIQKELKKGNKSNAINIASSFIAERLGIPDELMNEIGIELKRIQKLRLNKS